MNKTLKICALIALTAGIGACDEGKYNDLSCDPAEIKSACIDGKYYWECEAATNKFGEKKACAVGTKCSDETGEAVCVADEAYPLVCNEGAKRCSGNTIETCIENQWIKAAQACANGCADGACIDAVAPFCTEGAKQCKADGTGVQNCTNNAWVDGEACENGCENGECKQDQVDENVCDSATDTSKCDVDAITKLTCTDNVWAKESCVFGCENGACKEAGACGGCPDGEPDSCDTQMVGPICAPDGVTIIVCDNLVWTEDKKCENGCEDGACKESGSNPSEGAEPCVYGTDQDKCDDDGITQMTCSETNVWVPTSCTFGCDADTAVCNLAGACNPETDTEPACAKDNVTIITCQDEVWVPGEVCPNGCEEGKCKEDGGDEPVACDSTTDQPKCEEDNITLTTCTENVWVSEPCLFGCDAGACKEADACNAETDTAPKCALDNATILTCTESVWTAGEKCENGCEDGECKEDGGDEPVAEPCNSETDTVKCGGEDDAYVMTCTDSAWVTAETPCEHGCTDGICNLAE